MSKRLKELLVELGAELQAIGHRADVTVWVSGAVGALELVRDMGGHDTATVYVPGDTTLAPFVIDRSEAQVGAVSLSAQTSRAATPDEVAVVEESDSPASGISAEYHYARVGGAL